MWDIPILLFAYVLFWGPTKAEQAPTRDPNFLWVSIRGLGFTDPLGILERRLYVQG